MRDRPPVREETESKKGLLLSVSQLLAFIAWDPLPKRMHTLIFGPCTCVIKHWGQSCAGLSHKQVGQIAGKQTSMGIFISQLLYTAHAEEVSRTLSPL